MRTVMATSSGHSRPNEDFVCAAPDVMVLLDGAGIIGTEAICRHGVAWYSHTLGATLLARTSQAGDRPLTTALAESIELVAEQHRHTCDVANPSSPQSTVAIVRRAADRVDYLVLADSFIVLDPTDSGPMVIADPREITARRESMMALNDVAEGSLEHERARDSAISALQARRNRPGGYWIAKDDPQAATEAITGSVPLEQLNGAALLSNGASRIVDPYRLSPWTAVLELLRAGDPDGVLQKIREAESGSGAGGTLPGLTSADDATIAYVDLKA